jgi:hypothetical protein
MITVSSFQKNYLPVKTIEQIFLECPLCKHKGKVSMFFYQIQAETSAGFITTKQISGACLCNHCEQEIPNVRWDKEYHNFFTREKKKLHLKSSFQLKKMGKIVFWGFAGFCLLIIVSLLMLKAVSYFKR